ncbi:ribonuclease P protein component [Desulfovibrio ferrophilus]|uniref:Ribonuclease P protein component n=1 Tax=Desulfovibrio ferrophilus TaxID=241368 RepID=A0A2Z6B0Q2_9BACT|nr:ribonuclease P protein component [Desulfovibrio ferrophilus]
MHRAELTAPIDYVVVPKRHVDAKRLGMALVQEELSALVAKSLKAPGPTAG